MPQQPSTPISQDFVLFDDHPSRHVGQDRAAHSTRRSTLASPAQRPLDNNQGRTPQNQSAAHLSTPHLANVNHNLSAPNLNRWFDQQHIDHSTAQPRPSPLASAALRHSFPAYENTTTSDNFTRVNMNKDETMENLGFAESGAFDDDPLRFDAYFNDDAANEASATRFTPINDPSGSMSTLPETVSPADLLYNDFSAPNSNSFTNLTTPSMLDDTSPFLTDSANVSPAFELGDFNGGAPHDSFAPLFPSDEFAHLGTGTAVQSRKQDNDFNSSTESLARNASAMAMSRSTSARSFTEGPQSVTSKADILRHRLGSNSGISKPSRRATKALGPIEVDESDERALKRAKNTLAARKSRQKKKDEVDVLESKLIEMVEERDYWKMMAVRYGAPVPEGN